VILIGICLLAAGGMLSLLIAANRKEATRYCKSIDVTVNGSGEKAYISNSDIRAQLQDAAKGRIINKRIETIDVATLETVLEKHEWIRDAELYFDTRDVLHVVVSQRVPLARVFTPAGASFYLDSAGHRMPLLPNVNVRVPVVTGYPGAKLLRKRDSAVIREVALIAQHLTAHPFWNAQIAQIDITPAGTFELLPVVGNHIIRIGRAENIEEKLANLLLFYKQVLRKTGFDKYAVVDVQFKDQVVGRYEKEVSAIDSVQLQRNIQELIKKTRLQAEADSLAVVEMNKAALKDTAAQQSSAPVETVDNSKAAPAKPQSNPVKKSGSNIDKKPAVQKTAPKAVMKKHDV
jgi:cell division protein FtsQ